MPYFPPDLGDGTGTGPAGPTGKSAYESAVDNGFVGTEADWLTSIEGSPGATGPTGPAGPQGPPTDTAVLDERVSFTETQTKSEAEQLKSQQNSGTAMIPGQAVAANKTLTALNAQWVSPDAGTTAPSPITAPDLVALGYDRIKAAPIEVDDFGAVGDGTTDDTQAFTDALSRVTAGTTKTIIVDEGNYNRASNLFPAGNIIWKYKNGPVFTGNRQFGREEGWITNDLGELAYKLRPALAQTASANNGGRNQAQFALEMQHPSNSPSPGRTLFWMSGTYEKPDATPTANAVVYTAGAYMRVSANSTDYQTAPDYSGTDYRLAGCAFIARGEFGDAVTDGHQQAHTVFCEAPEGTDGKMVGIENDMELYGTADVGPLAFTNRKSKLGYTAILGGHDGGVGDNTDIRGTAAYFMNANTTSATGTVGWHNGYVATQRSLDPAGRAFVLAEPTSDTTADLFFYVDYNGKVFSNDVAIFNPSWVVGTAVQNVGALEFIGTSSNGNDKVYADINVLTENTTHTQEITVMNFFARTNGDRMREMIIGNGVRIGEPQGQSPGNGSLNLEGVIQVEGTQVVGGQQPAIPDPTATYADPANPTPQELKAALDTAYATIISLLTSDRTHGLIAT